MSSTPWPSLRPLRAGFYRRVARWVRKRQGEDTLPLKLTSRRLYILPTPVGTTFGIVCFAMLLGSMNYNNSMGFALTFLLVATGLVAMHRCHRNLAGLEVIAVHAAPVYAGESAHVDIEVTNTSGGERIELTGRIGRNRGGVIDVKASNTARIRIEVPTKRRGTLAVARISLNSRYPLALLNCWTWLHVDTRCTVWPRPADDAPARPVAPSADGGRAGELGDEDFSGLRDYREGDSPRLIAWKHLARSDTLASKQFSGASVSTQWIDYDTAPGTDPERRLSVLASWIIAAEAAGDRYGLTLPDSTLAPARGAAHRYRCLDVLARFGSPEPDHAG
ncbi:MAG: DUF58 domain-containing protein [Pseudomonadota bacterium]